MNVNVKKEAGDTTCSDELTGSEDQIVSVFMSFTCFISSLDWIFFSTVDSKLPVSFSPVEQPMRSSTPLSCG